MKNYNETLKKIENIEELKTLVTNVNDDIADNIEHIFDISILYKVIENINKTNEIIFSKSFVNILLNDRVSAFNDLVKNPSFTVYSLIINDNNTIEIKESKRLFKFSNLEKCYQTTKSTETDKNGKPILNKSVTIFGALRFYGLCATFIRNCLKSNFTIDENCMYNISNVVIDDKHKFSAEDGKAFASNSNNSLEKQLNILVKFMGYDVKMLKKDVAILKLYAQKLTQDKDNAHTTVKEINTIKFADKIFSLVCSRLANKDVAITLTNDKKSDD